MRYKTSTQIMSVSLHYAEITDFDEESMMNAADLKKEIEERFQRKQNKLIDALETVKYVCATADSWTTRNGTFLGSTLHWLEPLSMQLKSAPFFRHRLKSLQNIDEIAEQFTSMSEKYRIKQKIVAIVTKNGWNYGNAFEKIGVMTHVLAGVCEFHEINFGATLQPFEKFNAVTHTLSQIATTDAVVALADKSYREIHLCVFEKLTRFWQKSTEYLAKFDDLVHPTDVRCNSLFDGLQFIINKGMGAINMMNTQSGVPTLTQRDHKFLVEFIQVAKPIAAAIDHLLKSNCYYAAFLPTIYTIDHAFQKLLAKEFEYCRPLLLSMHAGFKRRFEYCFDLKDERCKTAVLATCTHPFFKTRWLSPHHAMDKCIVEIVTSAVKVELQSNEGDGLIRKRIEHPSFSLTIYENF